MRALYKIVFYTLILGTLAFGVATVSAQGGEGGIIIDGSFSGDVTTLNPLLFNDTTSGQIINLMFPRFVGIDPATGNWTTNGDRALVTDWTISDDGTTYTFNLRDDYFWTDGTPVTSADFMYTFDAVMSGVVDLGSVNQNVPFYDFAEAPDANTVVMHFTSPACNNLDSIGLFPIIPAHVFQELVGDDFAAINELDWNLAPTVTAGPFDFAEFSPGEQVSVVANQNYPDTANGFVSPTGYIRRNVADQTVGTEQFLAGELTIWSSTPPTRYGEMRDLAANEQAQVFEWSSTGYTWLAWNLANPENPQAGLDEEGNVIEQEPHPILGDVRVRQAFTHGVDIDAVVAGAVSGEGVRVDTHSTPASWAFDPEFPRHEFNPERAIELLEEAGWVDDDGDPSTPRVAQGALYAEDGTELKITIRTNAGNVTRESTGTVIQDQLGQIGVEVDFQAIDFSVAIDQLLGQTFDGIILGWSGSFPDDPDSSGQYFADVDVPGSGFGFTSYYNPEYEALIDQANNLPGCDQAERTALYQQAHAMIARDVPYTFLFSQTTQWDAQTSLQNWDPAGGQYTEQFVNVTEWSLSP